MGSRLGSALFRRYVVGIIALAGPAGLVASVSSCAGCVFPWWKTEPETSTVRVANKPCIDVDGFNECVDPVSISVGWGHACAITALEGVVCWGKNDRRQLGNGTNSSFSSPSLVWGLDSGVVAITAGWDHTCAITSDGGVVCWGDNSSGQLGDGAAPRRNSPTQVVGLTSGVIEISAGQSHTCALTSAGRVMCWGNNFYGELGDGTLIRRTVPTPVAGLGADIVSISAGNQHTCALTSAGKVLCWGRNHYGEIGDGTTELRSVPTPVTGLALDTEGTARIVAISCGWAHTCVQTSAHVVQCWGHNFYGQLGDGSTENRAEPTLVRGLDSDVVALSSGAQYACVLTSEGAMLCWGRNQYGKSADTTTDTRLVPTVVRGFKSGVTTISARGNYACAVTASQTATCWGPNHDVAIGHGVKDNLLVPKR